MPGSTNGTATWRRTTLKYLTTASHIPTAFLGGFVVIHLSAPLVANLGGSALSTSVMLLGREYYQGPLTEGFLVFAPVLIHVSASLLKRALSPRSPRPLLSTLTVSAAGALLLLPQHVLTHRFDPMDASPPIFSLGPAQLDFSFVQHALQGWPIRSSLLYIGLVTATVVHAVGGSALLWELYFPKLASQGNKKKRRQRSRLLIGTIVAAVTSSLYVLWSEPLAMPLPSLLNRMDAVIHKSLFYRI